MDAVRPDPPIRHELELAAQRLLADPTSHSASIEEARKTLDGFFAQEAMATPEVLKAMDDAPRLQPMQLRAEQLQDLARIGREAVRYLSSGTPAPEHWRTDSLARIEEARKPSAIVRFQFLPALTQLVSANK